MKRVQKLMAELHDPQLELMLLRSCLLGAPKMNYLIVRCHLIKMWESPQLYIALQLNLAEKDSPVFGQFQFQLSTLPIRCSGLEVYNPADVSMFAFISSLQSTKLLQDQILEDRIASGLFGIHSSVE